MQQRETPIGLFIYPDNRAITTHDAIGILQIIATRIEDDKARAIICKAIAELQHISGGYDNIKAL